MSFSIIETSSVDTSVNQELLKQKGTGVYTSYVVSIALGGTTFTHGAVSGEIKSGGVYYDVQYAGAANITVTNLGVSNTFVYLDNAGNLQQQTSVPTKADWMQKIFTMVVIVEPIAGIVVNFEYLNSPIGQYSGSTRDLWLYLIEQGIPLTIGQVVTGRSDNLGYNVGAGSLMQFGSTGDIENPHVRPYNSVSNVDYVLFDRTTLTANNTDLPKFWDNAGVITALGSTTCVAHRLYRFGSGTFGLQYGQGNYANMDLCRVNSRLEDFVRFPGLEKATFLGWWLLDERATTTSNAIYAEFVEYTIGIQGGTSSSLSGCLLKGNNLSDLLDLATALTNLGLGNVTNLSDANQVATGALNSGSITSGFGDIDVGSSTVSAGDGDFSGNVGIGVNTPGSFTNWSVGKFLDIGSSTVTHNAMALGASQTANGQLLGSLMFYNQANSSAAYNATTSKNAAYVTAWTRTTDSNAGGDSGADLAFYTKPEAGLSGEVLRIDSIGNVGIGTSSPGTKLDVSGPIKSGVYTVGTVPSAAANTNAQITVTNDVIGQPVIAVSNGTTWRRTYDGAAVSTT
jgi:hypothetical protein